MLHSVLDDAKLAPHRGRRGQVAVHQAGEGQLRQAPAADEGLPRHLRPQGGARDDAQAVHVPDARRHHHDQLQQPAVLCRHRGVEAG